MLVSDLAEDLFHAVRDVYVLLSTRNILGENVMGLIWKVTSSSTCLGNTLKRKNHRLKNEEANKIEAIVGLSDNLKTLVQTLTTSRKLKSEFESERAEVIKGGKILGDVGEIIGKKREILGKKGEKILGEKILKAIKPLRWITSFTDSKLHVDLIDYEKRKGTPRRGRRRLRDPNEILISYSERCLDILTYYDDDLRK